MLEVRNMLTYDKSSTAVSVVSEESWPLGAESPSDTFAFVLVPPSDLCLEKALISEAISIRHFKQVVERGSLFLSCFLVESLHDYEVVIVLGQSLAPTLVV